MGFFSWKTSDTNRSICNAFSEREVFKVTMLLPTGEKFTEHNYQGYGDFGGKDFFDAVYDINRHNPVFSEVIGSDVSDRLKGVAIAFDYDGALLPKLVEDENLAWEDVQDSEDCDYQGYFYNLI